jgi:hypothetical protein
MHPPSFLNTVTFGVLIFQVQTSFTHGSGTFSKRLLLEPLSFSRIPMVEPQLFIV